ncbi:MAG: winged helix-turn-helix domain-containing protein [Candidatus Diapherotrites archaeon]
MDSELIKPISLLKSSKYRQKILEFIGDKTITPKEISKGIDVRINHVSMFLRDLKKNKLVECLNEEDKRGRLYQLTRIGKKVLKEYGTK